MVIGAITTAIRIGQIVYRVARFQEKVIGKAWSRFPSRVRKGVIHGSIAGHIIGQVLEYYFKEEDGGNLIGLPEKTFQQRPNNRQYKARGKVFKSARGRCYPYRR